MSENSAEIVHIDDPEAYAWLQWAEAQNGVDAPGCTCGHDDMGINWHTSDCRGRHNAVIAKARDLHRVAFAAGLLDAECKHDGAQWFDRTICADPCGSMHQRCVACGSAYGHCCWEGRQ